MQTPPLSSTTIQHLKDLTILLEPDTETIEDLHHKIEIPLQIALDTAVNKYFVLSEYNRDHHGRDSYRSPWSNEYYYPTPTTTDTPNHKNAEGTFQPLTGELRQLEEQANEVFGSYCEMYYGKESVGSVYLWNQGGGIHEGGFAGCFVIQKQLGEEDRMMESDGLKRSIQKGYWNSIHVVDVNVLSGGDRVKYELSTTVMLSMDLVYSGGHDKNSNNGDKEDKTADPLSLSFSSSLPMVVQIGASLSKQKEKICQCPSPSSTRGGGGSVSGLEHIANIGQMIEAVEIELRSNIDTLCIQKTKEVLQGLRKGSGSSSGSRSSTGGGGGGIASLLQSTASRNPMQAELMARLKQRSSS
jgi:capping protein beta